MCNRTEQGVSGSDHPSCPAVSVLMCVHNSEKHLAAAIESILGQSFRDFEFVIVNDGSTDRTSDILNRYAEADSRIAIFSHENCGLTRSLNIGLKACRGDLVARMDADDISMTDRFALQVDFLAKNPDCIAVGTAIQLIDSDGDCFSRQYPPRSHEEIESRLLKGNGSIPHPSAMMRRKVLLEVDGYDESFRYAQDLDLWLRLSEMGCLANLPFELLQYRMHELAVTATNRREQFEAASLAVKKACDRRGVDFDPEWIKRSFSDLFGDNQSTDNRLRLSLSIESGCLEAASKYAWNLVRQSPFSLRRWRTWWMLKMRRRPGRL